jgi:hypothetical protein
VSVVQPPGRPHVQETYSNEKDHRRQLAQGVNRALQGHINATLFVTLDPNMGSTTVIDARISPQTHAGLQPQTADAAAASTYIKCTNGSLTIFHANNGQTDRTFTLSLIG